MKMKLLCSSILALASCSGLATAGPIGTYYGTNFMSRNIDAIRGSTLVKNSEGESGIQQRPIAIVAGSIRTEGGGSMISKLGDKYRTAPDLYITPINDTHYTNDSPTENCSIFDGTDCSYNDGTHDSANNMNYSVSEAGRIIMADEFWHYQFDLKNLSGNGWAGITYDSVHDTLWINNHETGELVELNVSNGKQLFSKIINTNLAGLAMDVDHTLWFSDYGGQNSGNTSAITLYHYNTAGILLGTEVYANEEPYIFGAEIAPIPEPSSLALFGMGLPFMPWRKGRKAEPCMGSAE